MSYENPFALARASDYTDDQINSLWVEMGAKVVDAIIEPRSRGSKYILGGKGTGKTHLLRYYSYPATRMRFEGVAGLDVVLQHGFLAVFLRATGLDAARFEIKSIREDAWQQLFGVYLELRLAEMALDAVCDIKTSSPNGEFNDDAFLAVFKNSINSETLAKCRSVEEFREWVTLTRRALDDATNNAAFTGKIDLKIPFALGDLSLAIGPALGKWNSALQDIPLLYLIDEIENFNDSQQQVVNSLIRYGEGRATFRVTGRLYAIKTPSTLRGGEANREGSEFKKTVLDQLILEFKSYPDFARRFVIKRLEASRPLSTRGERLGAKFDPASLFASVNSARYYDDYLSEENIDPGATYVKRFVAALKQGVLKPSLSDTDIATIVALLTGSFPLIVGKLNILQYAKKLKKQNPIAFAAKIKFDAEAFLGSARPRGYYATAYGHYSGDLFAQLCRDAKSTSGVPYAGFDSFVKMSSGNPRNLLIILGRVYENAIFKGLTFAEGDPLPVSLQTEGVDEAARFMYESDSNYGNLSDQARIAVSRLASVLRTARFALNIPEVAPLTVSFAGDELTEDAGTTLNSALNFSLVFEIPEGRPDRNSQKMLRKIYLNPMLSPRWDLPIGRRGDLSLNGEMINAIFDVNRKDEFDYLLRASDNKWNMPFGVTRRAGSGPVISHEQSRLF